MSSVISHKKFDASAKEGYDVFYKEVEEKLDDINPSDFRSGIMLVIKKVEGGSELIGAMQLFDSCSVQLLDHLIRTLIDVKAKLTN